MRRATPIIAVSAVLMFVVGRPARGQSPTGAMVLDPQTIEMDMTFQGATIEVRAEIPAGWDAAVRIMSRPQRLELKRLGKKAGVLWMTDGKITLENVPEVYQVLSSAPLARIASFAVLAEWSLGYESLIPDRAMDAALREEFTRLKEHEGLFAIHEGALARAQAAPTARGPVPATTTATARANEMEWLHATFSLPARAPAGEYSVELIGFKDRQAVHLGSATLRLEHVGVARALRRLAMDHGLTYGIMASLIAMIAGLLAGFLFRSRSGAGH